jgi:hemerythrin-like domain-containing protein
MRQAIETLRREHDVILAALGVLQAMAQRATAGHGLDAEDASDLLALLKEFADTSHHGKEEGFLFPAMVAAGVPERGGPVGVMLAEHERGREAVRAMAAALQRGPDPSAFSAAADDYCALLRAHIVKENNVLFPMAERVIGDLEWHAMAAAFGDHEASVLGADGREGLEGKVRSLAAKYEP